MGDFNGDGILDLAVVNNEDDTVTILLGNGSGTFTKVGNPVPVGYAPTSVAVGDFNGDGVLDLAVANFGSNSNSVTILLGNGNGTFTQAANSPVMVGVNPKSVAVGDFNGDGILDLAVANFGSNSVTILLGNGNGAFTQAANSPVSLGGSPQSSGCGPQSVAVGDFNADGVLDLAVANGTCDTVTILLGNGNGTFAQAANSPATAGATSVAVGDFNGDGIPDMAVTSNTVLVLLSQLTQTTTATANSIFTVGAGTHLVDASYPGDSSYSASTSATTGLTAQKLTPSVTVIPNPTSITTAQALAVTITVGGGNGNPTPTGSVTLTSGSYASAATTLSSGSATINIPAGSLATGSDTLTASYAGDSNYSAKTGTTPVSVTVAVAPGASLTGTWQRTGKSTAFGMCFNGGALRRHFRDNGYGATFGRQSNRQLHRYSQLRAYFNIGHLYRAKWRMHEW
jgi:hypothetical protein